MYYTRSLYICIAILNAKVIYICVVLQKCSDIPGCELSIFHSLNVKDTNFKI